jgi:quinoprotein glucose dehydrogenase
VVPYNSVPLIYKDVVVVGANTPQGPIGVPGNARAFDARTGAKLWEFSSVALPGQPGHDTWEGDSWKDRSGINAWPFYFTLDEQRRLVYLPLASPTSDFYGGDRKGANLYGNSVVAVDVATGKYKWHFQTIHHDLWDHDPPAPPALFDIVRGGVTIAALAITTKSGYMYILNRETGQPVFGIEERPVPKSDVPGELAFPTQPFPVKPPPIARNSFRPEDLVTAEDTTAEHAQACRDLIAKNGGLNNAGPFTTWSFRPEGAPVKSSLVFPGGLGGANWGGVAWDPNTKYAFVVTQDDGALGWMEKTAEGSPIPYDRTTLDGALGVYRGHARSHPGDGSQPWTPRREISLGRFPWVSQKAFPKPSRTPDASRWQVPLSPGAEFCSSAPLTITAFARSPRRPERSCGSQNSTGAPTPTRSRTRRKTASNMSRLWLPTR